MRKSHWKTGKGRVSVFGDEYKVELYYSEQARKWVCVSVKQSETPDCYTHKFIALVVSEEDGDETGLNFLDWDDDGVRLLACDFDTGSADGYWLFGFDDAANSRVLRGDNRYDLLWVA